MASAPKAHGYLVKLDGRTAAGASASFDGRVAILYADSTLPEYRGRGVHADLILYRLAEARRHGCAIAMACTLPGSASQRNYERAGFAVAYTKTLLVKDGT